MLLIIVLSVKSFATNADQSCHLKLKVNDTFLLSQLAYEDEEEGRIQRLKLMIKEELEKNSAYIVAMHAQSAPIINNCYRCC